MRNIEKSPVNPDSTINPDKEKPVTTFEMKGCAGRNCPPDRQQGSEASPR
jgi:hypothetical protein